MNILLIYPEYPDTFFSFRHALRFISKKAAFPPLGLATIASLLPGSWQKKLVDLNITKLQGTDMEWADYILISAMYIQKESLDFILDECRKYTAKIVGGGPLFAHEWHQYPQIDHFIMNEGEITLPMFIQDIENGKEPDRIYKTEAFADLSKSPVPDFSLFSMMDYASMNIQVSRGCPYDCDFCEIPSYLGHKVRMKETKQILAELESLYKLNWRGSLFMVDDNFAGNKKQVKNDLLPALIKWMEERKHPFIFKIQTSINLADDPELAAQMVQAGIDTVFLGIETPSEESLDEANKVQNKNKDMLKAVKELQGAGLQVAGGFILGFDSDTPEIFRRQVDFIQESGIVWAMVGLLNAPKKTKLYERLKSENRLTTEATGSNTDYTMNFIPKMESSQLLKGYRSVIDNIYSPKPYYKRIRRFLANYSHENKRNFRLERFYFSAFIRSIVLIGMIEKGRSEFWKFVVWTILHKPGLFPDAIMFTISGYHFRRVYRL